MSEDFGAKYDGQDDFRAEQEARLESIEISRVISPDRAADLAAFRQETDAKMALGDAKYGEGSWAKHDQLAEAMNELVDLGNYAFLKWRQLKALQDRLDSLGVPRSLTGEDRLGVQPGPTGFVSPADPEEHIHQANPYAVCPICRGLEWEKPKDTFLDGTLGPNPLPTMDDLP